MTTVVVLRFMSVTPLYISTETVGGFPAVFMAAKKCYFQQELWASPLLCLWWHLRYFQAKYDQDVWSKGDAFKYHKQ